MLQGNNQRSTRFKSAGVHFFKFIVQSNYLNFYWFIMLNTKSLSGLATRINLFTCAVAVLFLSGCAHQNYMEEGQKFAQSNQYEAAVQQFELALNEEPDNEATKNQLANAQHQLSAWATALDPIADQSLQNNQLGKALLLYGKSAQITKSQHAVTRYKEVYEKLRGNSIIKAKVLTNSVGLNDQTLSAIDGITFSSNPNIKLGFAQSNPIFEIQQSTQDAVTQYISGTQLIANPELVELQHELQSVRNDRHSYERRISNLRSETNSERSHVQQLSGQLQRVEMSMSATNLSPTQQSNYNQQASNLRSQLSNAKSSERSLASDLNDATRSYNRLSEKMHHLASDLSLTPAVVEVPVYSDYVYQEFTQTNSLNGVLYLNIDKVTRTASVAVSSSDTSHPAHPTIDLAANAMSVLSQQQLMPQYNQERYNIGLRLINELIAEHKASFLYQAQDSANLERKMTLLVQHGLVTHKGASENGALILKEMLISEFGQGGIFNINELLHLY